MQDAQDSILWFAIKTRITHHKHHVHWHEGDTADTDVGDDTDDVYDKGGRTLSEKMNDVCLLKKSDLLIPLRQCLQNNS